MIVIDGHVAPVLGVLGGSGVYGIDGLMDSQWVKIESPFGMPSDDVLLGILNGQRIVFLPRHGRGHTLSPTDVNYRANIDVLKRAGVTDLVSVSAVGSFREDLPPGSFILVDQFIDRTFAREGSFFGEGLVAHVSMACPVCARLGAAISAAAKTSGIKMAHGGTYLVMEGPQFSSRAESKLYRTWGCDVIGMTNMPEAKLAREAEICYATVAMVTDYDCWHPQHDDVKVSKILDVMSSNADRACTLVSELAPTLAGRETPCPKGCNRALDASVVTAPEARDQLMVAKLSAVAGRAL